MGWNKRKKIFSIDGFLASTLKAWTNKPMSDKISTKVKKVRGAYGNLENSG